MKLTHNLKIFIAINFVSTIVYVLFLKYDVGVEVSNNADGTTTYSSSIPFLYALVWLLSGLILGKYDKVRDTRLPLEFMYHAAMYVICLPGLIFASCIMKEFRDPWGYLILFIAALITLGTHWIFTRRRVKGIDAKAAFK